MEPLGLDYVDLHKIHLYADSTQLHLIILIYFLFSSADYYHLR